MFWYRIVKGAMVILATLGTSFQLPDIHAGEQTTPARPSIKFAPANAVLDVSLSKDGAFTGRVIDHSGEPVRGTSVVVKQGNKVIGESTTDHLGNFSVPHLKPGLYEVSSSTTVGSYRMWTEKTAPPSAMPHGLLVLGENGVRGQYGLTQTIAGENLGLILLAATTGLALTALVIAIHAKNIADSANANSLQSP